MIQPLYLARQRRNPVNIYLRRDVGIWAGITALLHVFFSLKIYAPGQEALLYFSTPGWGYYFRSWTSSAEVTTLVYWLPLLSLFQPGALERSLVAVAKGKAPVGRRFPEWTYPLIVLAILHTLGYQFYNERDGLLLSGLGALTLIACVAQGAGIVVHKSRERQRALTRAGAQAIGEAAPTPALRRSSTGNEAPVAPEGRELSRRRFLVVGGATLLAGIAALSFKVTEEMLRSTGAGNSPVSLR